MDKTQKNSRFGIRDETINHIIKECSKLVQRKNKIRLDWVRQVTNRELHEKFKFDITNKWYMHNPKSVLEIETHKPLLAFEIQIEYLI